ncbi:MAG: hypothetical protein A2840_00215 [Candidatus Buchananbacteria bacterium RIFCSPHIGHO2_01_FULL_47_11b]|uniref:Lipoprotein n=1 Tax=Candidatus Buchananbacteria bacterium RIFCSPHIGHO2_01_FULL_47_11b TaxID=1797537 RepID=A0A1G1Y5I3_9BACT|nr:MAG: hypothetical protein A2840_00215 [Candidatus Buchananbacteria bacterium RIFCSPHIGHO2_01_FULL_47_11b]
MNRFMVTVLVSALLLTACNFKDTYTMQYSFIAEPSTETLLKPRAGGLQLSVPFADFTCDAQSVKAVLDRDNAILRITLQGTETEERCSQRFDAEIDGTGGGNYLVKVIYQKGDTAIEVLSQEVTIE